MNDLVVGLHKELRQFNLVSIKNRFGSVLALFFAGITRLPARSTKPYQFRTAQIKRRKCQN